MKGKWMYVAAAGMREGPGASFNGWVASRRWEMVGLFSGYSPSIHSIPFFLFLSSSSCNPPLHTHAHRYKAALSVTFLFPLPSSSSSTTDRHVLRRHRPGLEERRRLIKRDHSRKKNKETIPLVFYSSCPFFPPLYFFASFHLCSSSLYHILPLFLPGVQRPFRSALLHSCFSARASFFLPFLPSLYVLYCLKWVNKSIKQASLFCVSRFGFSWRAADMSLSVRSLQL